jgi:NTE family protein
MSDNGGASAETTTRDALARVPLLAGLDPALLTQLAESSESVALRAGEYLFREGDEGDALFIVDSGRLEAVAEGEGEVIRVLSRGDAIGELALLTGEPRSASIRARRDSSLLRIGREVFAEAIEDAAFAASLLQTLGRQLRLSRAVEPGSQGPPPVVAILGLGSGAPTREVAEGLRERIAAWDSVALLEAPAAADDGADSRRTQFAELLDRAERDNGRVLLLADDDGDAEWRTFCTEQADRTLAVAGDSDSRPAALPAGCDLVLGAPAIDTARLVTKLDPRTTHMVSAESRGAGLDRLARRLSGRSVGVVLSGGGARGFAHIGALETLLDAGVVIDRVGGCSMGAMLGALLASGLSPREIRDVCQAEMVEQNPFNDYTLPVVALIRRGKATAMVRRMFGEKLVEELPLGYFSVSADLIAGELVVHSRGSVFVAVGASINIPGISPPLPDDGRLLVDGGVLNNLPVDVMAATGEGPVIAVDVTSRYEPNVGVSRRPRARVLQERFRELVVGDATPLPAFPEILMRTLVLGSIDTAETAQQFADVVIEPEVSAHALMAFEELDEIVEKGRVAAARALESERVPTQC